MWVIFKTYFFCFCVHILIIHRTMKSPEKIFCEGGVSFWRGSIRSDALMLPAYYCLLFHDTQKLRWCIYWKFLIDDWISSPHAFIIQCGFSNGYTCPWFLFLPSELSEPRNRAFLKFSVRLYSRYCLTSHNDGVGRGCEALVHLY